MVRNIDEMQAIADRLARGEASQSDVVMLMIELRPGLRGAARDIANFVAHSEIDRGQPYRLAKSFCETLLKFIAEGGSLRVVPMVSGVELVASLRDEAQRQGVMLQFPPGAWANLKNRLTSHLAGSVFKIESFPEGVESCELGGEGAMIVRFDRDLRGALTVPRNVGFAFPIIDWDLFDYENYQGNQM